MKKILILIALCATLYSEEEFKTRVLSPEEIEQELLADEALYAKALKMFNPWYAGPLITGSATIMGMGSVNIQPYLFVNDNFAAYDLNRHSNNLANDLIVLNYQFFLQTGIAPRMDAILAVQGNTNMQNGESSTNIGDPSITVRLALLKQDLYTPGILIGVGEVFPLGKYNHLNPTQLGLDSMGGGVYKTFFVLNMSKVIWWVSLLHPFQVRAAFNYGISTTTHVTGENAYGGGAGANGTVRPGNTFTMAFGYEQSFTQRWVAACDLVYNNNRPTRFHGDPGVNPDGSPATIGTTWSDNLSLAPALEYNPSEAVGIVGGLWFSVLGRNSLRFVSGVFTVTASF